MGDLFIAVQRVSRMLEHHYRATSLTLAIQVRLIGCCGAVRSHVPAQDGPDSGQTVEHVHVHVIPRLKGDYANNDEVYEDVWW